MDVTMNLIIKYFSIIICFSLISILINQYAMLHLNYPAYFRQQSSFTNLKKFDKSVHFNQSQNMILLWTEYFGRNWLKAINFSTFTCPSKDNFNKYCQLTDDRSLLDKSRAVLFQRKDFYLNDMPTSHFDGQYWVLYDMEATIFSSKDFIGAIKNEINWTATFRHDSDIFSPYGQIMDRKLMNSHDHAQNFNENPIGFYQYSKYEMKVKLSHKKKEIAWIVSNCYTRSKREKYVEELQKYIPVDIYGQCGPLKCEPYRGKACYQMVERDYKFYLSFESCLCKDYVTEKLFEMVKYDVIPIVYGGANYSQLMPYNSYIDAHNFTSPQKLAEYIKIVSSDEAIYNSYFEWKKDYQSLVIDFQFMCDMCQKLIKTPLESKSIRSDLMKWWFQDSQCKS